MNAPSGARRADRDGSREVGAGLKRARAHRNTGLVLALLAAACWGGAVVMSKSALDGIPPVLLLVIQLAASVAALWPFVLLRRTPRNPWRQTLRFAWLGLLEPGLAYLVGLFGLRRAMVSSAALIQALESVIILGLGAALFRDYPRARVVGLSLLALGALAVALGLLPPSGAAHDDVGAELILLAATILAALYAVLANRIADEADPIYIVAWQQTAALALSLVALGVQVLADGSAVALPRSAAIWSVALGSGVVQYAMAFSLSLASLRYISLPTVGASLTLIPVFAIAAARVFLGEKLPVMQELGAIATVVLVGMISLEEARGHRDLP